MRGKFFFFFFFFGVGLAVCGLLFYSNSNFGCVAAFESGAATSAFSASTSSCLGPCFGTPDLRRRERSYSFFQLLAACGWWSACAFLCDPLQ
eukprot:7148677-Prymnesium_polylepis.1